MVLYLTKNNKFISFGFDVALAACGTYVEYEGNVIYNIDLKRETVDKAVNILLINLKVYLRKNKANYR